MSWMPQLVWQLRAFNTYWIEGLLWNPLQVSFKSADFQLQRNVFKRTPDMSQAEPSTRFSPDSDKLVPSRNVIWLAEFHDEGSSKWHYLWYSSTKEEKENKPLVSIFRLTLNNQTPFKEVWWIFYCQQGFPSIVIHRTTDDITIK